MPAGRGSLGDRAAGLFRLFSSFGSLRLMRILVALPAALDSPLANAINTFKMADGYARLGHEVFVVCREPNSVSFTVSDLRTRLSLSDSVVFEPTRSRIFWPSLDRNEVFAWQVARKARELRPAIA